MHLALKETGAASIDSVKVHPLHRNDVTCLSNSQLIRLHFRYGYELCHVRKWPFALSINNAHLRMTTCVQLHEICSHCLSTIFSAFHELKRKFFFI